MMVILPNIYAFSKEGVRDYYIPKRIIFWVQFAVNPFAGFLKMCTGCPCEARREIGNWGELSDVPEYQARVDLRCPVEVLNRYPLIDGVQTGDLARAVLHGIKSCHPEET